MQKPVLSASRRVEFLYFPDRFLRMLDKYPPRGVHSIVLWTKKPQLLYSNECRTLLERLQEYDQLYFHISITGLGSHFLEPNIPSYEDTISFLPKVVDLVGTPNRISVRFDPIINVIHKGGTIISNFHLFPKVAEGSADHGITKFIVSWMSVYSKVRRRLETLDLAELQPAESIKEKQAKELKAWEKHLGICIKGCCTQPFFPASGCIDGKLLSELHPKGEKCSLEEPLGQRPLCKCTKSIDIGWYYQCPNGCIYCYGQPKIDLPLTNRRMEHANKVKSRPNWKLTLHGSLHNTGSKLIERGDKVEYY